MYKVQEAFKKLRKPVIIEETALCFKAYGGLPGPYIKQFVNTLGTEKLYKMGNALEDNSAYSETIFGIHNGPKHKGDKIKLLVGKLNGKIVQPKGENGSGFDPIFQPDGQAKTFGEMTAEEKHKIWHRALALNQLVEYIHIIHPKVSEQPAEHEHKEKAEHKESKDHKETKDHKDSKDHKEHKEHKESKDHKDLKDHKEVKDHKEHKEHKDNKELPANPDLHKSPVHHDLKKKVSTDHEAGKKK